jgi:hypothetical protein
MVSPSPTRNLAPGAVLDHDEAGSLGIAGGRFRCGEELEVEAILPALAAGEVAHRFHHRRPGRSNRPRPAARGAQLALQIEQAAGGGVVVDVHVMESRELRDAVGEREVRGRAAEVHPARPNALALQAAQHGRGSASCRCRPR